MSNPSSPVTSVHRHCGARMGPMVRAAPATRVQPTPRAVRLIGVTEILNFQHTHTSHIDRRGGVVVGARAPGPCALRVGSSRRGGWGARMPRDGARDKRNRTGGSELGTGNFHCVTFSRCRGGDKNGGWRSGTRMSRRRKRTAKTRFSVGQHAGLFSEFSETREFLTTACVTPG